MTDAYQGRLYANAFSPDEGESNPPGNDAAPPSGRPRDGVVPPPFPSSSLTMTPNLATMRHIDFSLPVFYGANSTEYEDFKRCFTLACSVNGVDGENSARIFASRCRGNAMLELTFLPEHDRRDISRVLSHFDSLYGSKSVSALNFDNVRFEMNDTVASYRLKLLKAFDSAFPHEIDVKTKDYLLKARFVSGFTPGHTRKSLLLAQQDKDSTFEGLVMLAQRLLSCEETNARLSQGFSEPFSVCAVVPGGNGSRSTVAERGERADYERRISDLEHRVGAVETTLNKRMNTVEESLKNITCLISQVVESRTALGSDASHDSARHDVRGGSRPVSGCLVCASANHMKQGCPIPFEQRKCNICNRFGHVASGHRDGSTRIPKNLY